MTAHHAGLALLAKGFRPFFLLAAAYVAIAMPLWVLALGGKVELGPYFGGSFWHAHEMVFGFSIAVIAGFLLTAVGNWTGRETVVGAPLGFLALLWLFGRGAVLYADRLPRFVPAIIDVSFLPALAFFCGRALVGSKNRRNYGFLALLGALSLCNLSMHLGALGVAPAWLRRGVWLGVELEIAMIVLITARVVPMFTRNATRAEGIRNLPWLDRAAVLGMVLLLVTEALGLDERLIATVSLVTGVLVLGRSWHWGTRHTLRHSLLWVLHLGHAFVAVGLALRAVSYFVPALAPTTALHALTAGGIGLLTIGMMARVSLGHTGRMIAVRPVVAVAFGMVAVAALIRIVGPLFGPIAFHHAMTTAGLLFALGFGILLFVYLPMWVAPRVDGKPG